MQKTLGPPLFKVVSDMARRKSELEANLAGNHMVVGSTTIRNGGPDWVRTSDPVTASDVLSQLSYRPMRWYLGL